MDIKICIMDLEKCNNALNKALQNERPMKLLNIINSKLKETNKENKSSLMTSEVYLQCSTCQDQGIERNARAFFAAPPPTIVLCANRLYSDKDVEEALVHELIHTYDYVVRDMDITQGKMLACSEIRSAREAECYNKMKILCTSTSSQFLEKTCSWLKRKCVKKTAIKATSSVFPKNASTLVNEVFTECYDDATPFDYQRR